MTEPCLLRDDKDGIVTLTMNRPAALNALSDALLTALAEAFDAIATDPAARVVILRGAGRAFCAGHDLTEMQAARSAPDRGAAYFADLFARCSDVMLRLPALPQPVIAEVQGIATAAGCQLVASCDMAVAASGTRFGVNGVNIGLFCSTPMVALTRVVPRKAAFEMLTTGEFIGADHAQALGLVNRVVPPDALSEATRALAVSVAAKMPAAVRIGKRGFYDQIGLPTDQAYALMAEVMAENMLMKDTDARIHAFLNRRSKG